MVSHSPAYASTCLRKFAASSIPVSDGVPIQFWTSVETVLWPPHSLVRKIVLRRLRAAYIAAAAPAGPPPTIANSYIGIRHQCTGNRKKSQDILCISLLPAAGCLLLPS